MLAYLIYFGGAVGRVCGRLHKRLLTKLEHAQRMRELRAKATQQQIEELKKNSYAARRKAAQDTNSSMRHIA